MSRYKRRIIFASLALHALGLLAVFIYWLNTDPFKEPEANPQSQTQSNTLAEGETNESGGEKDEIPDTGKNPLLDYEDGDLSDSKIASLITDAQNKNSSLTTQEKVDKLNDNLKGISRTPVKEVEKMTQLAERTFGIKTEKSDKPIRERKPGDEFDAASVELYDFEIVDDGKYVLIYKDKNNIIIKDSPTEFKDFDPDIRLRLTLMQKGKENKKFKMLLDTTNSILNKLNPPEEKKSDEK
ncbi:MAG: hypothetical protein NE327_13120 [Lentisphaeraceae bacterium]|nr:hypothetical protein [Lentisphaeraceae bacterium]